MVLAFALDENLRGPVWQAILRHNLNNDYLLDVVRVGDIKELPLSSSDEQVLDWCEAHGRILLTEDRHTMAANLKRQREKGRCCPGILILPSNRPMRQIIDCLVLVAHAGVPGDFDNRISYL